MFSDFDSYLHLEFLVDYWYDEGAGVASAMLVKFDEKDWRTLVEQSRSRVSDWQVRCAEVLDLVDHPAAVDVLVEFLASRNDDVVVAAADSLRSKGGIDLSDAATRRLKNLFEQGSAPVRAVLSDLFERFGIA